MELSQQTLEVGVCHERCFHLLVVGVIDTLFSLPLGSLVFVGVFTNPSHSGLCLSSGSLLWYLCRHAAFTEMFALIMLVSVIQENAKPFHIAVVRVLALLDKGQVYSRNGAFFFPDSVYDDMFLFPAKHIDCKIRVLLLESVYPSVKPVLAGNV